MILLAAVRKCRAQMLRRYNFCEYQRKNLRENNT